MTKYPIILVHGIILKDIKFFKAFGKIQKNLRNDGNIVYTSKTDGLGTIENNALMLKKQIIEILEKHKVDKVNLICHSKGGLDSKYMINYLDMADKVASYTTISTPHGGSIFADKLLTMKPVFTKIVSTYLNVLYKIFGDKHPDSYKVCLELTKEAQDNIELKYKDDIFCMSFSSTITKKREDFLFAIPFMITSKFESKNNDGIVSVESSKFINYQGNIFNMSHKDIAGITFGKKKKEKVNNFYRYIVNILEKKDL